MLLKSLLLMAMCASTLLAQDREGTATVTKFVCPPCGADCHDTLFDESGFCPEPNCLMHLAVFQPPRKVGILIWDGVELLDFTGPGEVFAATRQGGQRCYDVSLVGLTDQPILSQGFAKIVPEYTIKNCPPIDILVIPGGGTSRLVGNEEAIAWIKKVYNGSDCIMSVCTGAFALAKADLLRDLEITTWYGALDALEKAAPDSTVRRDLRFIDSGDILTTAGVSAGIDGALALVQRLQGPDIARNTAKYMEYNWDFDPQRVQGGEPVDETRKAPVHSAASSTASKPLTDQERALVRLDLMVERLQGRPVKDAVRMLAHALESGAPTSALLARDGIESVRQEPEFRSLIRKYPGAGSAVMAPSSEPGERITVNGLIVDNKNEPVVGALVYAYQTNAKGVYSRNGSDDENPRLFTFVKTDDQGKFQLDTIRPASYPGEEAVEQHIHLQIEVKGHDVHKVRIGFEDDPFWKGKAIPSWAAKISTSARGRVSATGKIVIPWEVRG